MFSPSVSCSTSLSITVSLSSDEMLPERCLLSLPVSFCRVVWCNHFIALLRFSQFSHSIPCFFSFLFQSESCDYPLHALRHLPKLLYFSNWPCHLPTPLACKHTSARSDLRPGVGAHRALLFNICLLRNLDQPSTRKQILYYRSLKTIT